MTNEQISTEIQSAAERVARGEHCGIRASVKSGATVQRYQRIAKEMGVKLMVRPARFKISSKVRGFDLEVA